MAKQITITRQQGKVVFEEVSVTQTDEVFWRNEDTEPHRPAQFLTQTQVGPGNNSNFFPPYPPPLPTTVFYGCAIPGHDQEQGVINVYAPLAANTLPPGKVNKAYTATAVVKGGKAPYTAAILTGTLPPGLSLTAGSLAGTPTQAGSFTFTLQASDSMGNSLQQLPFTVAIAAA